MDAETGVCEICHRRKLLGDITETDYGTVVCDDCRDSVEDEIDD